jgi:alginate O-acetyltransferase complex protein AlgI
MRPLRSFLLLLVFLTVLTGLNYIFPSLGLFPSLREFLTVFPEEANKKQDTGLFDTISRQITDTIAIRETTFQANIPGEVKYYSDSLLNPLQPFLDSLHHSKGQVRIMYYGDSQVEGDRITYYLRSLLREQRGGTGPGLFLPVMPVMYTRSVWVRSSPDWIRYNYLSWKMGELKEKTLGPFMALCRYLPEGEVSREPVKASVRITPSAYADAASSEYDILRIFYSNSQERVSIKVMAGEKEILADYLAIGPGLHEISCSIKGEEDIRIEFEGRTSPDIYGISIESKTGVIIDNIPQRGSAGLEFTMVDRKNLEESFRLISPDLIIIHYGLNIVRNVRNDYSYYQRGLERQIMLLKEVAPGTPVLVIGVTDMASNEGDTLRSYENIPAIIESQKKAAFRTGAAFWDSYRAMGGKSSVESWVRKTPPLAQKDYVHFTYQGADTFSVMIAKAMFPLEVNDTLHTAIIETEPDTIKNDFEKKTLTSTASESRAASVIKGIFSYDPAKPFIFTAPAFWLFFLIVMAGYCMVYRKLFLKNIYLLLVSLFFYYKSGGLFLSLLILVTVIDFTCGLLIFNSKKKFFRRLFIVLSLLSNLGILAYFKYTAFFINTFNEIFGISLPVHDFLASFSNLHFGTSFNINMIILPVGISFFTFQSMSYTIDIYRRKLEPVRNILDFGFYVSFFPQLVAGPIVRASEFIPQLYKDFSLTKREFSHALFLICKGLIKKIIISDFIATNFIDRVFDLPAMYSGFENLMAVYGYGLQIYCDFSGYTDIAIGLALIMGFRLPINFNSPYKAAGIADFWKRWHISLSRWLKDYLYISLGGNRKGTIRTGFNLIITMLLGGLWHGASLRFVLWGGLHGVGLVINKIWNFLFGERLKSNRFGRAFAIFLTFNFVNFCWIFFRAPDMNSVSIMLRQIFGSFSPGSYLTVLPAYSSVFLLIAAGYIIHFLPEGIKEAYRGLFIRIPLAAQFAVVFLFALLIINMRTTDILPFIYFRF